MKPYFMDITAKIIAEVRNRTCIDTIDTEVLEEILQYELNEYYYELDEYYINDFYNEVSRAHRTGYDEGNSEGYSEGHSEGHYEGYIAGKSSSEGDVANAYDDGYSLGYDDGYSLGYDDGHSKGHSGV